MKPKNDEDRMHSIEQSLVASLLAFPNAIDEIQVALFPSHFANREFAEIYDAIRALAARGVHVSPTSVGKELRDRGKMANDADEQYLHDLWGSSATAANAGWCADQILAAWQRREAAKVNAEAYRALQQDGADFQGIMDTQFRQLEGIEKCSHRGGPRPMAPDFEHVLADAREAARNGQQVRGVSTGYTRLDWWTSGLRASNLIVLAARTAFGKTALAMNIAANVSRQDEGVVVIFSMEMSRSELASRISSSELGIDLRRINNGTMSEQEWQCIESAQGRLSGVGKNILLDVSGRVTTTSIRAHLRRISRRHKVALVVVDYLQLCGLAEKAESQYVRTSMISGDLKAIAVDFDVPVLALSQLSRDAARRSTEPLLSDLRDSGTIEQDANVVIFIHRDPRGDGDESDAASIIVAKNRSGPIGKFTMHWNPHCVRFSDYSDQQ